MTEQSEQISRPNQAIPPKALWAGLAAGILISALLFVVAQQNWNERQDTASVAASSREFPTYWDWQLGVGPLTNRLRDEVSVPLLEMRRGRPTPRLVKEYTWSPEDQIGAIHLRNQVFWSDGTLFNADQVAAAWSRLKAAMFHGYKPSAVYGDVFNEETSLEVIDSHTLEVKGAKSQQELELLLSYNGLRPIRPDLLPGNINELAVGQDGKWQDPYLAGAEQSHWLVGIGPYHLKEIKTGPMDPEDEIALIPNRSFYRGMRDKAIFITIAEVVAPAKASTN